MNERDRDKQSQDSAQESSSANKETTLAEWERIDIEIRLPLMRGVNPRSGDVHRRIEGKEL